MKNILTAVEGGLQSGVWLINDENSYVCINGKEIGKNGMVFYKIIFMIRKDIGNGTSGVPQLRFIMWILINLNLLT